MLNADDNRCAVVTVDKSKGRGVLAVEINVYRIALVDVVKLGTNDEVASYEGHMHMGITSWRIRVAGTHFYWDRIR